MSESISKNVKGKCAFRIATARRARHLAAKGTLDLLLQQFCYWPYRARLLKKTILGGEVFFTTELKPEGIVLQFILRGGGEVSRKLPQPCFKLRNMVSISAPGC